MQEHGHMEAEYHWSSRWSSKKIYLCILKLSVSGQKATASNIDLQTLYAENTFLGTARHSWMCYILHKPISISVKFSSPPDKAGQASLSHSACWDGNSCDDEAFCPLDSLLPPWVGLLQFRPRLLPWPAGVWDPPRQPHHHCHRSSNNGPVPWIVPGWVHLCGFHPFWARELPL